MQRKQVFSTTLPLLCMMFSGDQLAIAKETGRRLGMGTNMYPSKALLGEHRDPDLMGMEVDELIEKADGFAGVFPGEDCTPHALFLGGVGMSCDIDTPLNSTSKAHGNRVMVVDCRLKLFRKCPLLHYRAQVRDCGEAAEEGPHLRHDWRWCQRRSCPEEG